MDKKEEIIERGMIDKKDIENHDRKSNNEDV